MEHVNKTICQIIDIQDDGEFVKDESATCSDLDAGIISSKKLGARIRVGVELNEDAFP